MPDEGVALLVQNSGGGSRSDGTGVGVVVIVGTDGAILDHVGFKPLNAPRLLLADGMLHWAGETSLWSWGDAVRHQPGPDASGSLVSLTAEGSHLLAVRDEGLGPDGYECGLLLTSATSQGQRWRHPGWLLGAVPFDGWAYGFSSSGMDLTARLVRTSPGEPAGEVLSEDGVGDHLWGGVARLNETELVVLDAGSHEGMTGAVWRFDTATGQSTRVPLVGEDFDVTRWFQASDGPGEVVVRDGRLLFVMRDTLWSVSAEDGTAERLADLAGPASLGPNGLLRTWKTGGVAGFEVLDWSGDVVHRVDGLRLPGPVDGLRLPGPKDGIIWAAALLDRT